MTKKHVKLPSRHSVNNYFVDFTGLLTLLSSIIDMMPDSLSEKLFQKSIINPKTLIVLANSGSPEIRACVIKVSM